MTLRAKWEFEYTARNLATAAKAQLDFRTARLDHWQGKQKEVMQKIKDSGLEIYDPNDLGTASNNLNSIKYSSTQMLGGPQVVIDTTLQRDLNECQAKILHHRDFKQQYTAWVQVLEGNPEARVKLDHDDWMFFFGK